MIVNILSRCWVRRLIPYGLKSSNNEATKNDNIFVEFRCNGKVGTNFTQSFGPRLRLSGMIILRGRNRTRIIKSTGTRMSCTSGPTRTYPYRYVPEGFVPK